MSTMQEDMSARSTQGRRIPLPWWVIALAIIAVGVSIFAVVWASSGGNSASADQPKLSAKDKAALTIREVDTDCVTLATLHGASIVRNGDNRLITFKIGAQQAVQPEGPRHSSDSLSVPLAGNTPQEKFESLKASICTDPLVGSTVAHYFAHTNVADFNVLEHNPWLMDFNVDDDQINNLAARYVKSADASDAAIVKGNLSYQVLAEKLDTLLGRFTIGGIDPGPQSTLNYHLKGPKLGLPEVGLNPNQEKLPALVLLWTAKGACAPVKVFGFNVLDQRPEEFQIPPCAPVPAPPNGGTRPPGTTPSTNPPCKGCITTTTTTTPCKEPCVERKPDSPPDCLVEYRIGCPPFPREAYRPADPPPASTPGAGTSATTPPAGPAASNGTHPAGPNDIGYDPGTVNAPGGSAGDSNGTIGGGPTGPDAPPVTGDDNTWTGTTPGGGFQ